MKLGRTLTLLVCLSFAIGTSAAVPSQAAPADKTGSNDARLVVPDAKSGTSTYIVGYKKSTSSSTRSTAMKAAGVSTNAISAFQSLPGAIVNLTSAQKDKLKKDPSVAFVAADGKTKTSASEANPSWGLDRIDQTYLPLNNRYNYYANGAGVDAYVFDTGIYHGHSDFTGRIKPGAYLTSYGSSEDDNGHGSHVSGTVGGTVYGVAKKVSFIPIKVLDSGGSGTFSGLISGIDWAISNHAASQPAVANISIGGGYNSAVNWAVDDLIADGVTVAVSAGNSTANACNQSPAATTRAITVAASTSGDTQAYYSNYGSCVDLYAPGSYITSVGLNGPYSSDTMSGTSMASPHVAGVAALLASKHHSWSPTQVTNVIKSMASVGRISDASSGTPNLLLSIAPLVTKVTPSVAGKAGGNTLTITGRGLYDTTKVLIGGVAAKRLSVKSSSRITVRVPRSKKYGAKAVVVVTRFGAGSGKRLVYVAKPKLAKIGQAYGSTAGGTRVTITAKNSALVGIKKVRFGNRSAKYRWINSRTIQAIAPRGSGNKYIYVQTVAGTSAKTKKAVFHYGKVPTITKMGSSRGVFSGGAKLAIYGKSVKAVTKVVMGGKAAKILKRTSTRIIVAIPAHNLGRVAVVAYNRYGRSNSRGFSYVAPAPSLSSVSPNSGSHTGGSLVTLRGRWFYSITKVTFGSTKAAWVKRVSATQLQVKVPAHSVGSAAVRIYSAYGASGTRGYTFV